MRFLMLLLFAIRLATILPGAGVQVGRRAFQRQQARRYRQGHRRALYGILVWAGRQMATVQAEETHRMRLARAHGRLLRTYPCYTTDPRALGMLPVDLRD